jgi:predicted PurR-regulated permease PerM
MPPAPAAGSLTWAAIGRVIAAGLAVWVVVHTWQLWLLLLTALIIASAILPAARWGDRRRIPRMVMVVAVYLGAALILAGLGVFLVPALVEEAGQFGRQLPALFENVQALGGRLVDFGARWNIQPPASPADAAKGLQGLAQLLLQNTLAATAGVVGAVVGFFLVLILAAYLVLDAEHIGGALGRLLPARHRAPAAAVAERVVAVMGAYVRGQIVVSLCVGAIIAVGLAVLGVPYALLIGGVAAAINMVPFLGGPVSALLGILSAFNVSPMLAVWTVVLFASASLVESKLLVPFFIARATGLHPVAVLLAVLVGAKLAGFIGALVAVPLLAGGWEIVRGFAPQGAASEPP